MPINTSKVVCAELMTQNKLFQGKLYIAFLIPIKEH